MFWSFISEVPREAPRSSHAWSLPLEPGKTLVTLKKKMEVGHVRHVRLFGLDSSVRAKDADLPKRASIAHRFVAETRKSPAVARGAKNKAESADRNLSFLAQRQGMIFV